MHFTVNPFYFWLICMFMFLINSILSDVDYSQVHIIDVQCVLKMSLRCIDALICISDLVMTDLVISFVVGH